MAAMENMGSYIRRIVRLPLNILDLISRVLSHGIPRRNTWPPQLQQQKDEIPIVTEEWFFLNLFEQQYGSVHPFFYATRLMEALKMAKDESKFVFIYIHAPEEPATDPFCCNTLRSQLVIEFLDANFVSWGAVANRGEGFEMALALKASSFPICAVIAPDSSKTIAVLQQIEGPVSPEELVEILQRTMDEQGSAFRDSREAEQETLRRDRKLREEQDAAYVESLKKDKEKDRAREAKSKVPGIGGYQLISSFPRKVYGHEQLEMTLEEAGLHPNAALFLELI